MNVISISKYFQADDVTSVDKKFLQLLSDDIAERDNAVRLLPEDLMNRMSALRKKGAQLAEKRLLEG